MVPRRQAVEVMDARVLAEIGVRAHRDADGVLVPEATDITRVLCLFNRNDGAELVCWVSG